MTVHNDGRLMTVPEVADLFQVVPATVTSWCRKGWLTGFKTPGGRFRFRVEDIDRLVATTGVPDPRDPS